MTLLLFTMQKMLRRSLLYTAVTRARKAVIIVGQHAALQYALMNADNVDDSTHRRCTLLPSLLTSLPATFRETSYSPASSAEADSRTTGDVGKEFPRHAKQVEFNHNRQKDGGMDEGFSQHKIKDQFELRSEIDNENERHEIEG